MPQQAAHYSRVFHATIPWAVYPAVRGGRRTGMAVDPRATSTLPTDAQYLNRIAIVSKAARLSCSLPPFL